jgi:hypothetical protein
MKSPARISLAMLVATAALCGVAAPATHAAFGVTTFEAGTCSVAECEYTSPPSAFYTQAAGHPERGITSVELNSKTSPFGKEPEGSLKRLRVDVPPGLAADPEALPKCPIKTFEADGCPSETQVGETQLTVFVLLANLNVTGQVYNLEPSAGLPLEFGIHVNVPAVANEHIFLQGHVAWSGDYHEWFQIDNISKSIPILKSKLLFNGRAGEGNFLTLSSVCSTSTTSFVEVESYEGAISKAETHSPVGVDGCDKVLPFSPSVTITPETAQSDAPDGASTVVQAPQKVKANETNTSDIRDAHVTLPEGLTLNPSAAHGLAACTAAQIGIGTTNALGCPPGSKVGTVTIETDLPPGSLTGNVYLGSPGGGAITNPPFTIYLAATATGVDPNTGLEGVSVRLQGSVTPNPVTGRLEVTFANNPQLPFSELRLTLNGGEHAPLANPLTCGIASTDFAFTPYTGGAAAVGSTPFPTGGCPSPLPFSLGQSTADSPPSAGAFGSTAYTLNLSRADGQQYLSKLTTVLPAGLVGAVPSVTLCGEPQAQAGACPAASQIGSATANVGAGDPYPFTGPVFLTGPYGGSPYGLSIPIHAAAGPFDLGTIVTRATISVDPHSGRVIASTTLPTIFKGVPLRLRGISVAVNRPNFLFNPTNCGALATDTTLTSTFNATQGLSSPFSVANCNALPFKPTFAVSSSARTSKAIGAGLKVSLTQGAHQANIHSVVVQLPLQLPSRLTTLQKACSEATYAANPFACPVGSRVGSATVTTPVLPGSLSGPAYLVSHGGAAFPDLDLLLEGDGVHVILEGNTRIKGGVTTSTFASIPDVPVSSFVLDLPTGPYSALAANGSLCSRALIMPTTITAQSGAQVKQNTEVSVAGCPFGSYRHKLRILHRKIVGHSVVLRVQTLVVGRVSAGGRDLHTARKRVRKPSTFTLKVPLSREGLKALRASARGHHRLKITVRVALVPVGRREGISTASTAVAFRR